MKNNLIELGISIIDQLVNGYNSREMKKLELEQYAIEVEAELSRIKLNTEIERQNKLLNVQILENVLFLLSDLVKTDLEIKIIQQRVSDARLYELGNWITEKKKDHCEMNSKEIIKLKSFLSASNDIPEEDKAKFKSNVYEVINSNLLSIKENESFLFKIVQSKIEDKGIDMPSLKEEFKNLATLSMKKLLELNAKIDTQ